jgi:hypothetical protein
LFFIYKYIIVYFYGLVGVAGVAVIGVIVDDNCGPCPLINGVIVKNPVSVFCVLALVTQLEYGV